MAGVLVVLTGASGAGKTTLARAVQWAEPGCEVLFFDSIGVPSPEEMVRLYGSGEAWQRAMTLGWMERVAPLVRAGGCVLLEGQMRIAFIREALQTQGIDARIVLVDCSDAVRAKRLNEDRGQPELMTEEMRNWARFLRMEALESGCQVLNTGEISVADGVERIRLWLGEIAGNTNAAVD